MREESSLKDKDSQSSDEYMTGMVIEYILVL